jgi:hypothetical protein
MLDPEQAPTDAQIAKFEYLSPMLNSALSEMREFAKKKHDGIVSSTKIKILNRLLTDLRVILEREDSLNYLDLLSEDQLPQNSDAVIILGQYRAALDSFQKRHRQHSHWQTRELIERIERQAQENEEDEEYEEDEDYVDEK